MVIAVIKPAIPAPKMAISIGSSLNLGISGEFFAV
jgi:hypothetical protein